VTTAPQPEGLSPIPFVASDRIGPFRSKRLAVVAVMLVLAVMPGDLGVLTRQLMTDAYTQVSVFVAATLLLFYGSERVFKFDIGQALKKSGGAQVPLAALLGATPGCGGAVVVIAAHASGNVGFGAVVATLTATMGDAAFLLIATRPDAALVILPLSFCVGIISGWTVDRFNRLDMSADPSAQCTIAPIIGPTRWRDRAYLAIALPGIVVGAAQLGQVILTDVLGIPVVWIGITGITLGLMIWATSDLQAMTNSQDSPTTRMAEETSFITVWVIGAYLLYECLAAYAGLDLETMFQSVAPLLPLMAIVVGFIPGCGPQVLVTTLYINGIIPFAAVIGNAISNDGDALFPAIALNPRAAFVATVYSSIPAFIVAYGFDFLAPGFMN